MPIKHTLLCVALLSCSLLLRGQTATADFRSFYQKFESDCGYQQTHVEQPLMSVMYSDEPDDARIDTIWSDKWECISSFSSFEKAIERVSERVWRVVYGIYDTGFRLEYYFALKDNEWYLTKTVDLSM